MLQSLKILTWIKRESKAKVRAGTFSAPLQRYDAAALTVALATQEEIPLISSPYGMFELCGRLYQAGLPSFEAPLQPQDQQCYEE